MTNSISATTEDFVEKFIETARAMSGQFASAEVLHLAQAGGLFRVKRGNVIIKPDELMRAVPQLLEEAEANPELKPAIYGKVLADVVSVMENVGSENPICGTNFAQADAYSRIVPSDICEETFINTCSYLAKLTEVLDTYRPVCYIRNPSLKPAPTPSTTASVLPVQVDKPSVTSSATPTPTVSPSATASKAAVPADEVSASATSTPTVSSSPSVSANNTDLASTIVPVLDDLDVAGTTNATEAA